MVGTGAFVWVICIHIGECVSFLTHSWRNIPVSFLLLASRMVAHHWLSVREHWRKHLNSEALQSSGEKGMWLQAAAINCF